MQAVNEIYSRDGKLKAILKKQENGMFQVEFQQQNRLEDGNLVWQKLPGASMLASLEDAVEFASRHVGAGTEDFFDDDE